MAISSSTNVLFERKDTKTAALMHTPQCYDKISPEYLTPRQTAQLIGFSLRALEAMRARRIGPAFIKVGKAKNSPIRYHLEDVRAWMQSHREVTDAAL